MPHPGSALLATLRPPSTLQSGHFARDIQLFFLSPCHRIFAPCHCGTPPRFVSRAFIPRHEFVCLNRGNDI